MEETQKTKHTRKYVIEFFLDPLSRPHFTQPAVCAASFIEGTDPIFSSNQTKSFLTVEYCRSQGLEGCYAT